MNNEEIKNIKEKLEKTFNSFIDKVPEFEVLNSKYIPEGLNPHTRSICWLAEQVILQNTKKYSDEFGITDFEYPESDISTWDARLKYGLISNKDVFINIKVTNADNPIRKNDIASVKKMLSFYQDHDEPLIYYVVLKFVFDNNKIKFVKPTIVRYYPWVKDFVVNPRNEHMQSIYDVDIEERSLEDFLELVRTKAIEKGLNII